MKIIENKAQGAIILLCVVGLVSCLYTLMTPALLYKLASIDSQFSEKKIGSVKSLTNKVIRRPKAQWVWFDLENNDNILNEDRIFTQANSGIEIEFPEGTAKLMANTMIVLKSIGSITAFDIQYGNIQLKLKKNKKIRILKEKKTYDVEAKKDLSTIQVSRQQSTIDFHLNKGEYTIANNKKDINLHANKPDTNQELLNYKTVFAFEPSHIFVTSNNKVTLPFQFSHNQTGKLHVFDLDLNRKRTVTNVGSSNKLIFTFKKSGEFVATYTDSKTKRNEQRKFYILKEIKPPTMAKVESSIPEPEPKIIKPIEVTQMPVAKLQDPAKATAPKPTKVIKTKPIGSPQFLKNTYHVSIATKDPKKINNRKIKLPVTWKKVKGSDSYKVTLVDKNNPKKILFSKTSPKTNESIHFNWMGQKNLELKVAAKRKGDKKWTSTKRSIASVTVNSKLKLQSPQLVLPANGSQVFSMGTAGQGSSLLLSWEPSLHATGYEVQVAEDQEFTQPLVQKKSTKTDTMVRVDSDTKRIFWRVKATHLKDHSKWSEVRSFSFQ